MFGKKKCCERYSIWNIVYILQCTVYAKHSVYSLCHCEKYRVYGVKYSLKYKIKCTVYCVHCTVYSV